MYYSIVCNNFVTMENVIKSNIYLIDDDFSFRTSLADALISLGYQVKTFTNADEFLNHQNIAWPAVLVSDMRMPGKSGVELQQKLVEEALGIPIVFISGESTVVEVIRGFKQGAIDFIPKPFNIEDLLKVIEASIEKQKSNLSKKYKSIVKEQRLSRLAPREREVCTLMVQGFANPRLAAELNLSLETIKQYKQNVYGKLGIDDLAGLIAFMQD
jgi:FixJ family two-component response regulator